MQLNIKLVCESLLLATCYWMSVGLKRALVLELLLREPVLCCMKINVLSCDSFGLALESR